MAESWLEAAAELPKPSYAWLEAGAEAGPWLEAWLEAGADAWLEAGRKYSRTSSMYRCRAARNALWSLGFM